MDFIKPLAQAAGGTIGASFGGPVGAVLGSAAAGGLTNLIGGSSPSEKQGSINSYGLNSSPSGMLGNGRITIQMNQGSVLNMTSHSTPTIRGAGTPNEAPPPYTEPTGPNGQLPMSSEEISSQAIMPEKAELLQNPDNLLDDTNVQHVIPNDPLNQSGIDPFQNSMTDYYDQSVVL